MAWTAPRTWVVGEVVTAANLNTHLRDNLTQLGGGTKPSARVTAGAAQNMSTGVARSIDYSAETFDYGGLHVTGSSSHRLKVPTGGDGVYRIGASVTWASAGASDVDKTMIASIEFNSSDGGGTYLARESDAANASGTAVRHSLTTIYPLTAGQYVCCTVTNGTTSTSSKIPANVAAAPQNFWATWDSA